MVKKHSNCNISMTLQVCEEQLNKLYCDVPNLRHIVTEIETIDITSEVNPIPSKQEPDDKDQKRIKREEPKENQNLDTYDLVYTQNHTLPTDQFFNNSQHKRLYRNWHGKDPEDFYLLFIVSHTLCKTKNTIHQVTTMLAASKNVLFPCHNHLLPTSADDLTLWLSPPNQRGW